MPGMVYAIGTEIDRFARLLTQLAGSYAVTQDVPFAGVVSPAGYRKTGSKDIGLTLMGITHGSEWAGVAVLNRVLEHLIAGTIRLRIPVAFVRGNPWAARENKRFLERDLNRSFARGSAATLEERRAGELEYLLARTAYLVDFHQTMQPSDRAFFIFPYRCDALDLARSIAPEQTIVTHWGQSFSAEGRCTDEYVNASGGLGITVELGQNGFSPYQIAVGVESALWAITVATACLEGRTLADLVKERCATEPEIFTWSQIIPWPNQGVVHLDTGWTNFREVEKGQRLGDVDGSPILAEVSGRILFPKYLTPEQQESSTTRPTELLRVMRLVALDALPS